MVEAILVMLLPHVARVRQQLEPASGRPELGVWCSVACTPGTTKGMWLSVLHSVVLSQLWDMMAHLDAIHSSSCFLRTIYTARVPLVILSIIELEQTCPNHRHIYCSFFSRISGSMCSHDYWRTLRRLNRFLFFWSQITFTHHMKWSSRVHNELILSLPT